jgi:hypothetical protein
LLQFIRHSVRYLVLLSLHFTSVVISVPPNTGTTSV